MSRSERRLADGKMFIEYIKHLTALSTGSVVIIAAFLDKIIEKPEWKPLITVSIVGFLTCIATATLVYTITVFDVDEDEDGNSSLNSIDYVQLSAMIVTWLGFVIGILSLGIFTVRNLS